MFIAIKLLGNILKLASQDLGCDAKPYT